MLILPRGDVIFGYTDPTDSKRFIPHRYGGPARIYPNGVSAFHEHGIWLWSEGPAGSVWWYRSLYQSYRVVKRPANSALSSSSVVTTHAKDWPLSIPRRQRTPPHPEGLVDDRAYERSPES